MEKDRTLINDLTQGSVPRQLIRFSLPLMLANTLQVGFNLVDMFFVGRYAGTDALSAVSIGGQVTMLMFCFFLGVSTGGQIYVSQAVGAGKRSQLNDIIGNVITLSVLVGAALMVVIPLAEPILRLMRTPESILPDTVRYLVICAYVNILVALYNGLCGMLRGLGDSAHPTLFVAVATVINIALDYLFVAVFHWGAAGAAWATLVGQTTACLFALSYLFLHRQAFGFDFRLSSLKPRRMHMTVLLRVGTPVSAKNTFISLSMIFVNAQINGLGVVAVAVTGVCHKIQNLMQIMSRSMNDATAALVGQNMGAGKLERVRSTVLWATLLSSLFACILSALFLLFPEQIFGLFSSDAAVIAQAHPFMRVCCVAVFSSALMAPTIGLIDGVGFSVLNMAIAVADGVVARIALSLFFGYTLHMGALGFFLGNGLAGFVSVIGGGVYFLSGRWRNRRLIAAESPEAARNG